MADSKITALASIGTGTDPANDPLVIVDVSDVSPGGMSATGTTKKVTLNNLLACSPTATLASATISGDLTVDTSTLKVDSANNRVGIGTASPSQPLHVRFDNAGASTIALFENQRNVVGSSDSGQIVVGARNYNNTVIRQNSDLGTPAIGGLLDTVIANTFSGSGYGKLVLATQSTARLTVDETGICTWQNVGGVAGTAMTLNATGLGVGTTAAQKLTVLTNAGISAITATAADDRLIFTENMASANLGSQIVWKNSGNGNAYASIGFTNGAAGNNGSLIFSTSSSIFGSNNVERMRIDSAGNPIFQPSATPATLGTNGMLTVNATSNTNLRFSYRGSDGVTRVANITLA